MGGQANGLGFTPHLHFQKTTGMVDISNSGVQRVVTQPELPGFQMTIPAGVTITGWDGQPNTQVSIRRVDPARSPIPRLPDGLVSASAYMYYFGKQGGGTPSAPVPITLPNDLGLPPGTQVELWFYDEAPDGSRPNQMAKFGTGTVSADGAQIVPDPDPSRPGERYGQPRFCCGWIQTVLQPIILPAINAQRGGQPLGACGGGKCAGDPVDLATGIFVRSDTDLVLPGRIPIVFTRIYRTNGAAVGPFGPGTSHPYHVFLVIEGDLRTLVLPGGAQAAFPRQADGTFRNTTHPRVRGVVITATAAGTHLLRFKDGTSWTFGPPPFSTAFAFLIAQADRNGNTLSITRDSLGRATQITEPAGRSLTLTYAGTNSFRVTSLTDPVGRTVTYTYAEGGPATVTDPAGNVTQYTYDAQGRMATATDPRGTTVVNNTYDAAGRVVKQTLADGATFQFAYTVTAGVVTQTVVTDPRGNPTTYRFNGQGYPLSETDALGQTTTYIRDPATNLLLTVTDRLGASRQLTYDPNGNITQVTDALGNTWRATYDLTFNQVLTITDPLSQTTAFAYDPRGNVTQVTYPLGNSTLFAYNAQGDLVISTDALGNVSQLTYTLQGDLATVADPLGNTSTQAYDEVSRLIGLTDPRGKTSTRTYDAFNRLLSSVDPLGGTTALTYDPNGNLLGLTDARGSSTTHEYDPLNRLTKRTDPLARIETYTYDLNGNPRTLTDRKGQVTTHTYDAQNRRIRSDYADGTFVTHTYDPVARTLTATDSVAGTTTNAYDSLGRLLSQNTPQGAVIYTYDALGRRQAMQVGGQQSVTYTYDANSRLTQIQQGSQTATLAYDAANRRIQLALPNGVVTAYEYDAASRVIAQTYTGPSGTLGTLTYSYDAAGNRVASGGSWARTLLPAAVATSNYDASDQQLALGPVTQTFDANGNVLTQTDATGTTTYTWDARNRLSALSGPTATATFTYDALGRRIRKTINGATTASLYDELDIVSEDDPAGGATYLRTLILDEHLTRAAPAGTVGYLRDELASTVALAVGAGTLAAEYSYEPFGATQVTGSPGPNPFQFTGRENDGTGLYYYRARYYDPRRGRFLQEDPIGPASGNPNLYAYVANNPINSVDPLGLVDLNMFPPDQRIFEYARTNASPPDVYTVGSHGNPLGIYNSRGELVAPEVLAARIRGSRKWKPGMFVRLESCNVANGNFPQQLADELGVQVEAPDNYAWYYPNGQITVAPGRYRRFYPRLRSADPRVGP